MIFRLYDERGRVVPRDKERAEQVTKMVVEAIVSILEHETAEVGAYALSRAMDAFDDYALASLRKDTVK
jgi:hypothetical protein